MTNIKAIGRSENPEVPVSFGGPNLVPLVEIGLTDLPKSGGATCIPRHNRPEYRVKLVYQHPLLSIRSQCLFYSLCFFVSAL